MSESPFAPALRAKVMRGLAWKGGSQLARQLLRIVVTVVLARLLTPGQYGTAGMAIVFSTLVVIFGDLALGAALVQRKTLSEEDRSTVFWVSAAAGIVFTAIGIAVAGPLAHFYGNPQVEPLFRVLSLSFVFTSLGTTQTALLTRELDFRRLELRMTGATLCGAVVAICVAAAGFGAWAIIIQQLVIALASSLLVWFVSPWRPRFVFSRESLRSLGGFGGNVLVTRLLFYVNRNTDNLLIGRFVGAAALGAYSIAYNIMLVPFNQISGPIQEVLYPALARIQNERDRMASAWIGVNRLVATVSIPALLGLIVVAPDFVAVVLGGKWSSATRVIQILAWVGLLQSLQGLNSGILQALDRTRLLVRYAVIVTTASLCGFGIGLHWGLIGVATGYAISSTIVEPYYLWLTARELHVPVRDFLRACAGSAQASLAMAAAVFGARQALVSAHVAVGLRLPMLIALGIAVYVPLVWWREPVVAGLAARRFRRATPDPVGA